MKEIFSVIVSLIVPLLVAWISSRHHFKKDIHNQLIASVESAREFYQLLDSNEAVLIKDAITQKFLVSKNVNFLEAKYFSQFNDMEKWARSYIVHRDEITLNFNEKNEIDSISMTHVKKKMAVLFISYFVFFGIAIIPFLNFSWYLAWIVECIDETRYLTVLNLTGFPIILCFIGVISLIRAEKLLAALFFEKKFNTEKSLINQHESKETHQNVT